MFMVSVIYVILLNNIKTEPKTETASIQANIIEPMTTVALPISTEISITQQYIGEYELTAYVETGNNCADGVYPTINYTATCNDKRLWHQWIFIEGYGIYYVHDTGGMASNVIDIFMESYEEAINFGRRTANVYIVNAVD